MSRELSTTTKDLLNDWHRRVRESQHAHYEASKSLSGSHYWLGCPVVILSTFTGTSVFATLTSQPHLYFKIFVGIVSVLAAVLAAIQTLFKFSERSEKHRSVAVRYGAIRRDIEYLISMDTGQLDLNEVIKIKERCNYSAKKMHQMSFFT